MINFNEVLLHRYLYGCFGFMETMMGNIPWHEINDVDDKNDDKDNGSTADASGDNDKPRMTVMLKCKRNDIVIVVTIINSKIVSFHYH